MPQKPISRVAWWVQVVPSSASTLMIAAFFVSIPGCAGTGEKADQRRDRSWEVVGLGGYFFKASDPALLRTWYSRNLGFVPDSDGTVRFWTRTGNGPDDRIYAVWGPFRENTTYFEPSTKPFMFNFQVRNLDAMLAHLRQSGVEVDDRVAEYEYGRFAWITDPDGNRVELWEPVPGWKPKQ